MSNNNKMFNHVIGNPPYQQTTSGDNKTKMPPIFHHFWNETETLGEDISLIMPGRFLFHAGDTPEAWNNKMLKDEHTRVAFYEQDSSKVFEGTDIKGGVVIMHNGPQVEDAGITTFTIFPELNSALAKVTADPNFRPLKDIIYIQNRFDLEALYRKYPSAKQFIDNDGKDKRFETNIFSKLPNVFREKPQNKDAIKIIGILDSKRQWRYIERSFVDFDHENLEKWKVIFPASNGSGAIGEVISTPLIGSPLIGYTRSFISVGAFETEDEAAAAFKYIKSKFARGMLGVLKVTQHNRSNVWEYVPIQDFTANSDIDWSVSISEIDQQLYHKYDFDETEIAFFEEKIKSMEDDDDNDGKAVK